MREKIDRLCRVLREHKFVGFPSDEGGDRTSGLLVRDGGFLSQLMGPAMRSSIVTLVEVAFGLKHHSRLLRRCT